MPADNSVEMALSQLRAAVGSLESAVDARIEHQRENRDAEGEVRRVHADRARLAQELDESQFRANRLEEVNREVSRRLVTAMETIRAVLDR
jgi:chromosome segregation ATPase